MCRYFCLVVNFGRSTFVVSFGQKDDPGSYRPISFVSVPGKVISGTVMDQLKVSQGIRPSQHGFTKGRSYLTNQISFYDKATRLVNEGKAVNVVYLDFSKAFDTVPVGGRSRLVSPRARYWGHFYLTSSLMILMRGLSAPSVSLQVTPSWEGVFICLRGEGLYRGTWID